MAWSGEQARETGQETNTGKINQNIDPCGRVSHPKIRRNAGFQSTSKKWSPKCKSASQKPREWAQSDLRNVFFPLSLVHPHSPSSVPDKCEDPFSPQLPLRWENSIVCNVYSVNPTYLQSPPLPTPPFSLSIDTHWLLDCMDPPPFPQPHPQQLTKIMTCWKTINHFRVSIPEDSI